MDSQERAIRRVVIAGLLVAITLLLAFTPVGFIPVPTPGGAATTLQIPAILGGILSGPLVGLIVSMGFGVASILSPYVVIKDPFVVFLPRLLVGVVSAYVFLLLRRSRRAVLQGFIVVLVILAVSSPVLFLNAASIASAFGAEWNSEPMSVIATVVIFSISGTAAAGGIWALYWSRSENVEIVAVSAAAIAGSLTNTILVLVAAVVRGILVVPYALLIGVTHGIPEAVASALVTVAVVSAVTPITSKHRGSRL